MGDCACATSSEERPIARHEPDETHGRTGESQKKERQQQDTSKEEDVVEAQASSTSTPRMVGSPHYWSLAALATVVSFFPNGVPLAFVCASPTARLAAETYRAEENYRWCLTSPFSHEVDSHVEQEEEEENEDVEKEENTRDAGSSSSSPGKPNAKTRPRRPSPRSPTAGTGMLVRREPGERDGFEVYEARRMRHAGVQLGRLITVYHDCLGRVPRCTALRLPEQATPSVEAAVEQWWEEETNPSAVSPSPSSSALVHGKDADHSSAMRSLLAEEGCAKPLVEIPGIERALEEEVLRQTSSMVPSSGGNLLQSTAALASSEVNNRFPLGSQWSFMKDGKEERLIALPDGEVVYYFTGPNKRSVYLWLDSGVRKQDEEDEDSQEENEEGALTSSPPSSHVDVMFSPDSKRLSKAEQEELALREMLEASRWWYQRPAVSSMRYWERKNTSSTRAGVEGGVHAASRLTPTLLSCMPDVAPPVPDGAFQVLPPPPALYLHLYGQEARRIPLVCQCLLTPVETSSSLLTPCGIPTTRQQRYRAEKATLSLPTALSSAAPSSSYSTMAISPPRPPPPSYASSYAGEGDTHHHTRAEKGSDGMGMMASPVRPYTPTTALDQVFGVARSPWLSVWKSTPSPSRPRLLPSTGRPMSNTLLLPSLPGPTQGGANLPSSAARLPWRTTERLIRREQPQHNAIAEGKRSGVDDYLEMQAMQRAQEAYQQHARERHIPLDGSTAWTVCQNDDRRREANSEDGATGAGGGDGALSMRKRSCTRRIPPVLEGLWIVGYPLFSMKVEGKRGATTQEVEETGRHHHDSDLPSAARGARTIKKHHRRRHHSSSSSSSSSATLPSARMRATRDESERVQATTAVTLVSDDTRKGGEGAVTTHQADAVIAATAKETNSLRASHKQHQARKGLEVEPHPMNPAPQGTVIEVEEEEEMTGTLPSLLTGGVEEGVVVMVKSDPLLPLLPPPSSLPFLARTREGRGEAGIPPKGKPQGGKEHPSPVAKPEQHTKEAEKIPSSLPVRGAEQDGGRAENWRKGEKKSPHGATTTTTVRSHGVDYLRREWIARLRLLKLNGVRFDDEGLRYFLGGKEGPTSLGSRDTEHVKTEPRRRRTHGKKEGVAASPQDLSLPPMTACGASRSLPYSEKIKEEDEDEAVGADDDHYVEEDEQLVLQPLMPFLEVCDLSFNFQLTTFPLLRKEAPTLSRRSHSEAGKTSSSPSTAVSLPRKPHMLLLSVARGEEVPQRSKEESVGAVPHGDHTAPTTEGPAAATGGAPSPWLPSSPSLYSSSCSLASGTSSTREDMRMLPTTHTQGGAPLGKRSQEVAGVPLAAPASPSDPPLCVTPFHSVQKLQEPVQKEACHSPLGEVLESPATTARSTPRTPSDPRVSPPTRKKLHYHLAEMVTEKEKQQEEEQGPSSAKHSQYKKREESARITPSSPPTPNATSSSAIALGIKLLPIITLRHLRLLHLQGTSISSPGVLDLIGLSCPALESLYLGSCPRVVLVEPLGCLPLLRQLDIHSTGIQNEGLRGFGIPFSFPSLEELSLAGCAQVTDITPLGKLGKLTQLDLRGVPVRTGWMSLRCCPQLRRLWFESYSVLPMSYRSEWLPPGAVGEGGGGSTGAARGSTAGRATRSCAPIMPSPPLEGPSTSFSARRRPGRHLGEEKKGHTTRHHAEERCWACESTAVLPSKGKRGGPPSSRPHSSRPSLPSDAAASSSLCTARTNSIFIRPAPQSSLFLSFLHSLTSITFSHLPTFSASVHLHALVQARTNLRSLALMHLPSLTALTPPLCHIPTLRSLYLEDLPSLPSEGLEGLGMALAHSLRCCTFVQCPRVEHLDGLWGAITLRYLEYREGSTSLSPGIWNGLWGPQARYHAWLRQSTVASAKRCDETPAAKVEGEETRKDVAETAKDQKQEEDSGRMETKECEHQVIKQEEEETAPSGPYLLEVCLFSSGYRTLFDLPPLSVLPHLQILDLRHSSINDAAVGRFGRGSERPGIRRMPQGEGNQSEPCSTRIQRERGEGIPSLHTLYLTGCTSLTRANSLMHLPQLRQLDLSGTSVTDTGISSLAAAPALRALFLRRCPQLVFSSPFSTFPMVEVLDISHNAQLTTSRLKAFFSFIDRAIEEADEHNALPREQPDDEEEKKPLFSNPFQNPFPALKELYLSFTAVDALTPLLSVTGTSSPPPLRVLEVSGTPLTPEGMRHLHMLPHLQRLRLSEASHVSTSVSVMPAAQTPTTGRPPSHWCFANLSKKRPSVLCGAAHTLFTHPSLQTLDLRDTDLFALTCSSAHASFFCTRGGEEHQKDLVAPVAPPVETKEKACHALPTSPMLSLSSAPQRGPRVKSAAVSSLLASLPFHTILPLPILADSPIRELYLSSVPASCVVEGVWKEIPKQEGPAVCAGKQKETSDGSSPTIPLSTLEFLFPLLLDPRALPQLRLLVVDNAIHPSWSDPAEALAAAPLPAAGPFSTWDEDPLATIATSDHTRGRGQAEERPTPEGSSLCREGRHRNMQGRPPSSSSLLSPFVQREMQKEREREEEEEICKEKEAQKRVLYSQLNAIRTARPLVSIRLQCRPASL